MPIGNYVYEVKGDKQVISGLTNMANSVKFELNNSLKRMAERTESEMKGEAPRRTGSFSESIGYYLDTGAMMASIGPNDAVFGGRPVGRTIELGRTPGAARPPAKALMDRYGLTLGQAIQAAKTISERGVRGNPFAMRTYEKIQPLVGRYSMEAVVKITEKFVHK